MFNNLNWFEVEIVRERGGCEVEGLMVLIRPISVLNQGRLCLQELKKVLSSTLKMVLSFWPHQNSSFQFTALQKTIWNFDSNRFTRLTCNIKKSLINQSEERIWTHPKNLRKEKLENANSNFIFRLNLIFFLL